MAAVSVHTNEGRSHATLYLLMYTASNPSSPQQRSHSLPPLPPTPSSIPRTCTTPINPFLNPPPQSASRPRSLRTHNQCCQPALPIVSPRKGRKAGYIHTPSHPLRRRRSHEAKCSQRASAPKPPFVFSCFYPSRNEHEAVSAHRGNAPRRLRGRAFECGAVPHSRGTASRAGKGNK